MLAGLNRDVLEINNTVYHFKVTNRTILDIDKKYGNYANILKGIMEGKEFYTNALKVLSCSCVEKDFELDFLIDNLTGLQLSFAVPALANDLVINYFGANKNPEPDTNKKKESLITE